jgi:glutamate-ammonia-ligase adenylyltransferase
VANPDQALESLIRIARKQPSEIRALLGKNDSAQRVCLLFGASIALTEFVERHPDQLQAFGEKPALKDAKTYQQSLLNSVSKDKKVFIALKFIRFLIFIDFFG